MAVVDPECPVCGDTFADGRGLVGHLKWQHSDLSKEKRMELKDRGMARGKQRQSVAPPEAQNKRSVRDRILELKGMLYEIEQERQEIDTLWGSAWSSGDQERLDELNDREREIRDELEQLEA